MPALRSGNTGPGQTNAVVRIPIDVIPAPTVAMSALLQQIYSRHYLVHRSPLCAVRGTERDLRFRVPQTWNPYNRLDPIGSCG
jgi:hypothetical protein